MIPSPCPFGEPTMCAAGASVPASRARRVGSDERSGAMRTKHARYLGLAVVALVAIGAGSVLELGAQHPAGVTVPIDDDDIGGVVTGPSGPEAGVWVIAETTALPTRFARVVVTDDQ